jgi:hypothetical protein
MEVNSFNVPAAQTGGPVFNLSGQILGIGIGPGEHHYPGDGYVVPIDSALDIAPPDRRPVNRARCLAACYGSGLGLADGRLVGLAGAWEAGAVADVDALTFCVMCATR